MSDCSIHGCTRKAKYKKTGWCQTHYHRWWRTGDPLGLKKPLHGERENSSYWKGDDVSYRAMHSRIARLRGKACDRQCAMCSDQAEHWAYDHTDPNPKWVTFKTRTVPYSTDEYRYVPLCRGCHLKVDRYGYSVPNHEGE